MWPLPSSSEPSSIVEGFIGQSQLGLPELGVRTWGRAGVCDNRLVRGEVIYCRTEREKDYLKLFGGHRLNYSGAVSIELLRSSIAVPPVLAEVVEGAALAEIRNSVGKDLWHLCVFAFWRVMIPASWGR